MQEGVARAVVQFNKAKLLVQLEPAHAAAHDHGLLPIPDNMRRRLKVRNGSKADVAYMLSMSEDRAMVRKVCPVIFRTSAHGVELLAFRHPSAGNQFVKGSIEEGESASQAAIRELQEESGIVIDTDLLDLGHAPIGEQSTEWHFFAARVDGLPERWDHQTEDDFGHLFSFFWHPLADDLSEEWHPDFHQALRVIRRSLPL